MTIGEVSKLVDLPTKTIRFYEDIKLLTPAKRAENNYRIYSQEDINILFLIKEARALGLDLNEVRNLVALCLNQGCQHINEYLLKHLPIYKSSIRKQIQVLESFNSKLFQLENDIKNKTLKCDGECDECNILCKSSKTC